MGYNIAMACDYFYPQLGGIEFHIYHLAQSLISLGHNVIVITHQYGDRTGVRRLANGLKVYHVPLFVLYRETVFPCVFYTFPMVRNILIRERIDIVHGHGSASDIAQEAILHANCMGLRSVFTDHSLYGFDVLGSVLLNKLLKCTLASVDRVICVSNACKENMMYRTGFDPAVYSVIPNAVVAADFTPPTPAEQLAKQRSGRITIVCISRLFPNKGCDLLVRILPAVCKQHPDVDFVMVGDGPRFVEFQQMVETERLEERITLMGSVPHEHIRDVLCRGDIYLHASLTEAFGTVLVEAAACNLLVVTTRVGGALEVLPPHMTVFAARTAVSAIIDAANEAITRVRSGAVDTSSFHDELVDMYEWSDVAQRTDKVYRAIFETPVDKDWTAMIKRVYNHPGIWARHLYVLCTVVEFALVLIFDFLYPRDEIDKAPRWPVRPTRDLREEVRAMPENTKGTPSGVEEIVDSEE